MSASKLVKPSVEYKESFLEALEEFQGEGRYIFLNPKEIEHSFDAFVDDLNSGRKHLHKPYADWVEDVPETILWLVKDDKYIGSLNIRHRLNWHLEKWGGHINFNIRPSARNKGYGKKILRKAKAVASYLGIERALLTIDPANLAAIHIAEVCGAEYQDITSETDKFPVRKRYWLECT